MLPFPFILLLLTPFLNAAPITTCDSISFSFTCPEQDSSGNILIKSPQAILPDAPYSIFDCVYGLPKTETVPRTCHYYKASGEYALGPDNSACPRQAPSCSAVGGPRFSVPEKVEKFPWVENGGYLLWMKEHHT